MQKKYCNSCGNEIFDKDNFCGICGAQYIDTKKEMVESKTKKFESFIMFWLFFIFLVVFVLAGIMSFFYKQKFFTCLFVFLCLMSNAGALIYCRKNNILKIILIITCIFLVFCCLYTLYYIASCSWFVEMD